MIAYTVGITVTIGITSAMLMVCVRVRSPLGQSDQHGYYYLSGKSRAKEEVFGQSCLKF